MRQPNGFTLVELVVAMLLLTSVLLGMLACSAMVTRLVRNGGAYSRAAATAVGRLELWRGIECLSGPTPPESKVISVVSWDQWPTSSAISSRAIAVTTVLSRGSRVDTFSTTGGC